MKEAGMTPDLDETFLGIIEAAIRMAEGVTESRAVLVDGLRTMQSVLNVCLYEAERDLEAEEHGPQ
jgi:hypothetical protein